MQFPPHLPAGKQQWLKAAIALRRKYSFYFQINGKRRLSEVLCSGGKQKS